MANMLMKTAIFLLGLLWMTVAGAIYPAQAAPMDICAKRDTTKNLIGFTKTIPEPAKETDDEDFCTITVTDLATKQPTKAVFLEPDGKSVSDILTVQNNAKNELVLCFASDPSTTACTLANPVQGKSFDENVDNPTTVDINFGTFILGMTSDCDPAANNKCKVSADSDKITIFAPAKAPEPATLGLLAPALLALGFFRRRKD